MIGPEGTVRALGPGLPGARSAPVAIPAGAEEDPKAVFQRVAGVRPPDDLRKPGYPESTLHWPEAVVFREGHAIARIGAPRTGEVWMLLVHACQRSGIGGS